MKEKLLILKNPKKSNPNYTLYIVLEKQYLHYGVYDFEANQWDYLKLLDTIDSQITNIELENITYDIARYPCRNAHLILDTDKYCIVPKELYKEDLKEKYITNSFNIDHHEVVMNTASNDMHWIFIMQKNLLKQLQIFNPIQISTLSNILQLSFEKIINTQYQHIYIHVAEKHVYIIHFAKNKKLLLNQKYAIESADDVLYYVIQCVQSSEKVHYYMSGHGSNVEEIYQLLSKYFSIQILLSKDFDNNTTSLYHLQAITNICVS